MPSMRKLSKKRSQKAGLPSGTLVYTGEKKDEKISIHVVDYDEANLIESELTSVEAVHPLQEQTHRHLDQCGRRP